MTAMHFKSVFPPYVYVDNNSMARMKLSIHVGLQIWMISYLVIGISHNGVYLQKSKEFTTYSKSSASVFP